METRVYSPTAILGYGFPLESHERAIREGFDVIAVDAGSTDPGPYYLGEGVGFVPEKAVERDLRLLVRAAIEQGVPLLIGTAGGAGAKPHVEATLRVLERVLVEEGLRARVAVIYTDVSKETLYSYMEEGRRIEPLPGAPPLTREAVEESTRIVAQIGVEPFLEGLKAGADIVLAGRSVDVAPFSAVPIARGHDWGLAIHMAKVLECGAIAADPGSGSDGMMGVIRGDHFQVYPLNPRRKATVTSVAEHALYERRDPYRECIPGGCADLSQTEYSEDNGVVTVRGTRWIPAQARMVKLEAARLAGYRTVWIAGARDPGFIERHKELIRQAEEHVRSLLPGDYRVYWRVYGVNGVMSEREPSPQPGHEIAVMAEVVAGDPETSKTVAGLLRSTLLHLGWPGRKTTAGNLAFPLSPSDLPAGRVYEWSIWHLVEERDPLEHARIGVAEYG